MKKNKKIVIVIFSVLLLFIAGSAYGFFSGKILPKNASKVGAEPIQKEIKVKADEVTGSVEQPPTEVKGTTTVPKNENKPVAQTSPIAQQSAPQAQPAVDTRKENEIAYARQQVLDANKKTEENNAIYEQKHKELQELKREIFPTSQEYFDAAGRLQVERDKAFDQSKYWNSQAVYWNNIYVSLL